jgi:DNA-binding LacI/PurR family transcriptional regulator
MSHSRPKPKPTSADVAREAHVSRATVSYVLNDVDNQTISNETRQAVLAAAGRLGYRPNPAARSLKTGRNNLAVFVVPSFTTPGIERILSQLTGDLAARGVALVGYFESDNSVELLSLVELLDASAVLSVLPLADPLERQLRERDIRVISFARANPKVDVDSMLFTDVGALQARYLVGKGHHRIAYAQTDDEALRFFADERLAGVLATCEALRLPAPPVQRFALDGSDARATIERWHAEKITAICAYNDEVAHVALYGIRAASLQCPGDIAVIGMDDIPLSAVAAPPLTSIGWEDVKTMSWYMTGVLLSAIGQGSDFLATSAPKVALVVRERESA